MKCTLLPGFFFLMKFSFPCDAHFSLLYYSGQGNTDYEPDPVRNSPLRSFSCQERQVCSYPNGSWRWFGFGKSCRRPKQEVALEICVFSFGLEGCFWHFSCRFKKAWWGPWCSVTTVCGSFRKEIWWQKGLGLYLMRFFEVKKKMRGYQDGLFYHNLICMKVTSTAVATMRVYTFLNSHLLYFLGKEKYLNE